MTANAIDVAIIGAGPYGLSVAAHLAARDVTYQIFGSPMSTWRSMPEGMLLRSPGFGSDLSDPDGEFSLGAFWAKSGRAPEARLREPIPLDAYLEYGQWFIDSVGLAVEDVMVRRLARDGEGFHLELESGEEVHPRRVVMAVGLTHYAYLPPELAVLPASHCSHSASILQPAEFAGRDVVVVGAGQSALETAALLHEAGSNVQVVARCRELLWTSEPLPEKRGVSQRLRYPDGRLCAGWRCWAFEWLPLGFRRLSETRRLRYIRTEFGPHGAYWLRDRLADVPITLGKAIGGASIVDDAVHLELQPAGGANGAGPGAVETVSASHVIAGTGYRVDLERLSFVHDDLRRTVRLCGPAPALSSHFESSAPGLYFVGASSATTFGPVTRFVAGATFSARRVSRHVAHASGAASATPPRPAAEPAHAPEPTQ